MPAHPQAHIHISLTPPPPPDAGTPSTWYWHVTAPLPAFCRHTIKVILTCHWPLPPPYAGTPSSWYWHVTDPPPLPPEADTYDFAGTFSLTRCWPATNIPWSFQRKQCLLNKCGVWIVWDLKFTLSLALINTIYLEDTPFTAKTHHIQTGQAGQACLFVAHIVGY